MDAGTASDLFFLNVVDPGAGGSDVFGGRGFVGDTLGAMPSDW
jgi:hypothetical protein